MTDKTDYAGLTRAVFGQDKKTGATEGPYRVGTGDGLTIWQDSNLVVPKYIAKCESGLNPISLEECQANAKLLAASWEMAGALASLVKWMDDSGLSHTKPAGVGPFRTEPIEYSVVREAREALRKAGRL